MAASISVEEAANSLLAVIGNLAPGEEVILTQNHLPVARIVAEPVATGSRPLPGLGKGTVVYMAPDFDEPLEEFRELS
ncbi:type II toxin-antitoxin system Phd/YefM family antitoxin [Anatilimnocola sp. NA78]|uniref:type II toxin-antitoxin system Phd/YefM family antitoxin n=1 Tax=Anatilimnocola sp. NA78 TaxID=3415683 RepID=UPI003CE536B6